MKSTKSHVTTEATSLANVSDPASGSSNNGGGGKSSPQHNYSNIQHPIKVQQQASNSLTSSRTQSSNASPALAESPLLQQPPNIPPPPIPNEVVRSRTPMLEDQVKKSKLVDVQDLIHLPPPLSEDLVLRTLQARFCNKSYFVSQYF